MPRDRSDLELAIGKLIVMVQREWQEECGDPEAKESLSVMYRCHDLLRAAKADELKDFLNGRSLAGYLGGLWLGTHPNVTPSVEAVAKAMAKEIQ
ncbi:hypothetical protein [Dyella mobilis]|uniref:Uncharacterized protein n=1 Tax=Dyella mobilis TaxID=1849582 RepID=A0ABS2KD94_9GAMM|nr:hypothetical protein [Dyella mobilis]MBM7128914.1 hypothetical protein [Dyella mobilis]GLQ99395.1 hypothetical protein GCM10007863_38150 [Dyella mobilis]